MSIWADIGDFVSEAWDRLFKAGTTLIQAGISVLPIPSPSAPPPTNTGGSGGSSTGNPGSGGGSFTSLFSEPINFLKNISEKETWIRVGLVLLGIMLVILAVRMFLKAESPVARTMRELGI